MYVGVEGKARKVKKGYIGDKDGIPRLFLQPYEQLVNYTMLYDYGDECTSVTGGWTGEKRFDKNQGDGFFTKETAYLEFGDKSTSSYGNGGFYSEKSIDLTDYTLFGGDMQIVSITNYSSYKALIAIGISTVYGATSIDSQYIIRDRTTYVGSTQRKLFSIDVTSVKKSGYVAFFGEANDYPNQAITARCHGLWLCKADNWSELASKAGLSASSISNLLTKSSTILNNKDAVEFMIYQCTGDFMASALQNSTFLTALESSPYKEAVYANEHWAKFLAMVA
jgi:hypothetical protein